MTQASIMHYSELGMDGPTWGWVYFWQDYLDQAP